MVYSPPFARGSDRASSTHAKFDGTSIADDTVGDTLRSSALVIT
jgi:hypothetical protein